MPINMAFFFKSTPLERVIALYPSPGRSDGIVVILRHVGRDRDRKSGVLRQMEADVEALLVNRVGHFRGFSDPETTSCRSTSVSSW